MMPELVFITFIIEPLHSTILHRFPLKVLQDALRFLPAVNLTVLLAHLIHQQISQPVPPSPAYGLIPFPQCAKKPWRLQAYYLAAQCDARSWWRWEPGRWSSYPGPGQPTKWGRPKGQTHLRYSIAHDPERGHGQSFCRRATGRWRGRGWRFDSGHGHGVCYRASRRGSGSEVELAPERSKSPKYKRNCADRTILAYEAMPNHSRFLPSALPSSIKVRIMEVAATIKQKGPP